MLLLVLFCVFDGVVECVVVVEDFVEFCFVEVV